MGEGLKRAFAAARRSREGPLTRRQEAILRTMAEHPDDDEGELVYERGVAYLGLERVAARTVFALIRLSVISLERDSVVGSFERYRINETGVKLLEACR